jgi:hypothetical protein
MQNNNTRKIESGLNSIEDAVIIVAGKKESVSEPFVIMFYDALQDVINNGKINMTDMRVLLAICSITRFGNCINMSQMGLAEALKIDKSQISRTIKKLLSINVLIESSLGLFINPALIIKGKLSEIDTEVWDQTLKAGFKSPLKSVMRTQMKREKIEQRDIFGDEINESELPY